LFFGEDKILAKHGIPPRQQQPCFTRQPNGYKLYEEKDRSKHFGDRNFPGILGWHYHYRESAHGLDPGAGSFWDLGKLL
jgi:hypothetical protein